VFACFACKEEWSLNGGVEDGVGRNTASASEITDTWCNKLRTRTPRELAVQIDVIVHASGHATRSKLKLPVILQLRMKFW
jgi:hypothetical protein